MERQKDVQARPGLAQALMPAVYDLPSVIAQSGYPEENIFSLGMTGDLVFLVVVPECGACRVPDVALSHFMAGAETYIAEAMPEYYQGVLSAPWVIKRERLRILADSWDRFSSLAQELAEAIGVLPPVVSQVHPGTGAKSKPPIVRNKLRTNTLDVPIDKAIKQAGSLKLADVYLKLRDLALSGELPFTGAVDGNSLCYTTDDSKPAKLTKNALGKRLGYREKSSNSSQ